MSYPSYKIIPVTEGAEKRITQKGLYRRTHRQNEQRSGDACFEPSSQPAIKRTIQRFFKEQESRRIQRKTV